MKVVKSILHLVHAKIILNDLQFKKFRYINFLKEYILNCEIKVM